MTRDVELARLRRNPVTRWIWDLARNAEAKVSPPPRFVIVATGRSGTKYAARLLTAAGVRCTHENVFSPAGVRNTYRTRGDASWLAVPFLSHYQGIVLHQVRNPLDVVNSLCGIRFFSTPGNSFISFATRYFQVTGDDVLDGMRWYVDWNGRCERYAQYRYRVEEMSDSLDDILALIAPEILGKNLEEQVSSVPSNVNTRSRANLTLDDLPTGPDRDALLRMADRYGYQL